MNKITKSNTKKYNKTGYPYLADAAERIRIKKVIDLLKKHLKGKKSNKLLDIGCGDGTISIHFLKLGFEVYGIDAAIKALEKAGQKEIKTKLGDFEEKLPYKNDSFDVVFAGEVIEHIFDVKNFLSEIHRILKKNGILILTTPNLASLEDRIKFLFGINPTHVTPVHEYLHFHIRPFTKYSLKKTLTENGFKIEKITSNVFNLNIFSSKYFLFSETLAKLLPGLSWNLVVEARKK